MAQTLSPPPIDPYDPDADEHPEHKTAPRVDTRPAGDPSNPGSYDSQKTPLMDDSDPRSGGQQPLFDDEDNIADQEQAGDGGVPRRRPGREQARESGKAESPSSVKDSEEKGGGWFRADEDGNRLQRGRSKLQNGKAKIAKLGKSKIFVGVGVTGGASLVGVFIVLVLIAGSLKIPNFTEHVTTYAFARVLRQSVETDGKITNEKFAVDSLTQRGYDYVKNSYQGLRDNTWGKFDKYRPQQAFKNISNGKVPNVALDIKYGPPNTFGRQQLKSVVLNSKTYAVENQGASRFIPGFSRIVKFKNGVSFSKDYAPALSETLKSNNMGPIARGAGMEGVRKELGIGFFAWNIGKYKGQKAEKARLTQARELNKVASDGKVDLPKTGPLKDAVEDGDDKQKEVIKDDKKLTEALNNGGISDETEAAIEKSVAGSSFDKALAVANPTYGLALSGCIIYDGSLSESKGPINARARSQKAEYVYAQTASDQMKPGDTTGEAVGAFDGQLKDITTSNAEVKAAGGKVDTSNTFGGQASAGGEYSILDAILGAGPASTVGNVVGKGVCPTLTNTYVATGGAAVLAALSFLSGGSVSAASTATSGAIEAGTAGLTERLFVGVITKFGSEQAAQKAGAIAGKSAFIAKSSLKSGAKVGALTVFAKLIVMSRMHALSDGLEQGPELANNIDSGGDQTASDVERFQYYGRPLTKGEIFESKTADAGFIKSQTEALPATQRYFALSNPDSLLNRMAAASASMVHHSIFASFFSLGSKLFNPFGSLNSLFGSALTPKAAAASASNLSQTNYGNVQWGYSNREMNILRLDFSYRPLENKSLLQQSGEMDTIEAKYHDCYDPDKEMGDLLADGLIVRDKDGNVEPDQGLCAPNHLAYDSTDPDFQPHMIFRWRVAHNYDNGLDKLTNLQTVSADDTGMGAYADLTTAGTLPVGSAKELATRLTPYLGSKIKCNGGEGSDCSDISNTASGTNLKNVATHDGKPNGCLVESLSPSLLGMLLKLVEMGHTFVLSALCTDHHSESRGGQPVEHSAGKAVDFNYIDGTWMGAGDTTGAGQLPWSSEKVKAAKKLDQDIAGFMPKTTEFGQVGSSGTQVQCHETFGFQANFKTYPDTCHHQHVAVGG